MSEPQSLAACPLCHGADIGPSGNYQTKQNGPRKLLICRNCGHRFSETLGSPMAGLKAPLSQVCAAIRLRSEGLGLRATARVLNSYKRTIAHWEDLFGGMRETLALYGLCHQFISLVFEGDELYTIVRQRTDPQDSTGWTTVIMDRASRFLIEQRCGAKDADLFRSAMIKVAEFAESSHDLTFLSDGERRYGNTLFDLCGEALRTGKRGRPRITLPEGVKVRIKNKGDQRHRRGRKRAKYQAPCPEHPANTGTVPDAAIHADHCEAHNAALRRRNSAFRRRTNTYAKTTAGLQRTLDVNLIVHNYVRRHWTTGKVPAVALGILREPMSIETIMGMRKAA